MVKALYLLVAAVLALVVFGVAASIGAKITQDVRDDMNVNSTAYAAAGNATLGISELASWSPTISTVIAATVIISLLIGGLGAFLYMKGQ